MEENNIQPSANQPPAFQPGKIDPHNELMPPKRRFNKDIIFIVLAVLAILITLVLAVGKMNPNFSFPKIGGMSDRALAQKAVDFLNANSATYLNGSTATLGTVESKSGLVKFQAIIGGKPYDSYISKDGKLLFPNAIEVTPADTAVNPTPTPPQPPVQAPDISKVNIQGTPFIGNANAPAVMAFWSDYQCPFCKKAVEETISQLKKDYVNSGKLKIVFKEYAFLGPDSQTLSLFARAVWEAAPAKFGTWHEAMFANQGHENSGWATEAKLMEVATKAIGATDANKALTLFKQNKTVYQAVIDADKAEGISFGITGTPATIIGTKLVTGADVYSSFSSAVDVVLGAK